MRRLWSVLLAATTVIAVMAFASSRDTLGSKQPGSTPAPQASPARQRQVTTSVKVEMGDLFFRAKKIEIPADTEVTVTLKNVGVLPHDFNIDELDVHSGPIQPGETGTVKIKAPDGLYQYSCNQVGHKAAGMVGLLTVSGEGGSSLRNAQTGNAATAQAIDVPPFQGTITSVTRTDTVGTMATKQARGVYIIVRTKVRNTSNAPVSIADATLAKATLRDSQGRTYELDAAASIAASSDIFANAQPDLLYQVALAFDVSPDASGFTLTIGGQDISLATIPTT